MDVPRAPALGLFLNQVCVYRDVGFSRARECSPSLQPYYDFYNKKYGNDGVHQPIDFDLYKVSGR